MEEIAPLFAGLTDDIESSYATRQNDLLASLEAALSKEYARFNDAKRDLKAAQQSELDAFFGDWRRLRSVVDDIREVDCTMKQRFDHLKARHSTEMQTTVSEHESNLAMIKEEIELLAMEIQNRKQVEESQRTVTIIDTIAATPIKDRERLIQTVSPKRTRGKPLRPLIQTPTK